MSTDFTKNLSKFGTSSKIAPREMCWCGEDSVILYWEKILLVIGPYGDFVKYTMDHPLIVVPECDGVRLITQTVTSHSDMFAWIYFMWYDAIS